MTKVRAHAFYAPSHAHEWMDCAPAVLTELGEVDDTDDYNSRGNLLHDFGHHHLAQPVGSTLIDIAADRGMADYEYTAEDAASVAQYVDYVNGVAGDLRFYEVHSWFMKGLCGGTSDAVIIDTANHLIEVIDYKAGFIRRLAKANYQLIIYALGVVARYGLLYDIRRVKMTIVQPMRDGGEPSTWTISVKELLRWGQRIRARVVYLEKLRAAGHLGVYNPTPERCQFCPVAKRNCPELVRATAATAEEDYADYVPEADRLQGVTTVPDAEMWRLALLAETHIKKLKERVTSTIQSGTHIEGFKQVRGNGKWGVTDKKGLVKHLTSEGFGETDIFIGEPELLSKNRAEKLYSGTGSGAKRKKLEAFYEKTPGAPIVVLETDKRPAIDDAADAEADFADYTPKETDPDE